jgi:hypothetical protein
MASSYVAAMVGNRITAIPDAVSRGSDAGTGFTLTSGGAVNGPLGPAIAPTGDVLTVNSGDGNVADTTPPGTQIAKKQFGNLGSPAGLRGVGKTVLLNSFRSMAAVRRRPTSSSAATSD